MHRVVPLETSPNPFDLTLLNENFVKEYRKLLNPKSDAEPGPPQLILLDVRMQYSVCPLKLTRVAPSAVLLVQHFGESKGTRRGKYPNLWHSFGIHHDGPHVLWSRGKVP